MKAEYKLTARQIKELDEINITNKSIEAALQVALNFYSNQREKLEESTKALWDDVFEANGIDAREGWKMIEGKLVYKGEVE